MPSTLLGEHRISAIVPCLDEADCLPQAYAEISAALAEFSDYEILFIDDGSTDDTLALIRALAAADPHVRYLSFTRNFGLEAAFNAGFRYARHPWTVQLDADLQSPPQELHKLFYKATEGFDVVFADRPRRRDPWFRRVASRVQQWLAERVFGIELPRGGSTFRVARTSVAKKIVALDLGMPYFLATVALLGARYTSVPTEHRARLAGRSRWPLARLIGHTVDLYTAFSFRLLSFVYLTSAACVALAAAVAVGVDGAPLVMLVLAALAIDVAIIARYLVRIIRGQSRTPGHFLIRETNVDIDPGDSLYEFEFPGVDSSLAS